MEPKLSYAKVHVFLGNTKAHVMLHKSMDQITQISYLHYYKTQLIYGHVTKPHDYYS